VTGRRDNPARSRQEEERVRYRIQRQVRPILAGGSGLKPQQWEAAARVFPKESPVLRGLTMEGGVCTKGASPVVAGLISEGEQIILRPARGFLYEKRRSRGGRQASIARMSVRVQVKQFVHQFWVLCQKAESFLIMWTVGAKTSPL